MPRKPVAQNASNNQGDAPQSNKSRFARYPTHPLAWLTFHSEKILDLRDFISDRLKTPEGIDELKNWIPPASSDSSGSSLSRKARFVLKAMQESPDFEEDIFSFAKMRAKFSSKKNAEEQ